MTNTANHTCETDHCSKPDQHSSLDCYKRYVELEYEGPQGGRVMTYEEWVRV